MSSTRCKYSFIFPRLRAVSRGTQMATRVTAGARLACERRRISGGRFSPPKSNVCEFELQNDFCDVKSFVRFLTNQMYDRSKLELLLRDFAQLRVWNSSNTGKILSCGAWLWVIQTTMNETPILPGERNDRRKYVCVRRLARDGKGTKK